MTINLPRMNSTIQSKLGVATTDNESILLLGYAGATGTATPNTLYENLTTSQALTTFGANTHLHKLYNKIKEFTTSSQISAYVLDDATFTASKGKIQVVDTVATADEELIIEVLDATYKIIVNTDDTQAQILTKIETALSNNLSLANIAIATDAIEFEYVHKGVIGNNMVVAVASNYLNVVATPFSGGVGAGELGGLAEAITDTRYQNILVPQDHDIKTVTDILDSRENATNILLDGVAFTVGVDDNYENLIASVIDYNSKFGVKIGVKQCNILDIPDIYTALLIGYKARRTSPDGYNMLTIDPANVGTSNYNSNSGYSGLPYFNADFTDYVTLSRYNKDIFTEAEIKLLSDGKITQISYDKTGNSLLMGEAVTFYTTDSQGNTDPTFRFLNIVTNTLTCREIFTKNLQQLNSKVSYSTGTASTVHGQKSVALIKKDVVIIYNYLARDLGLLQTGFTEDNRNLAKEFQDSIVVARNETLESVTISYNLLPVTAIREINQNIFVSKGV